MKLNVFVPLLEWLAMLDDARHLRMYQKHVSLHKQVCMYVRVYNAGTSIYSMPPFLLVDDQVLMVQGVG